MKSLKLLALSVCASAFFAGCASHKDACCAGEAVAATSCKMKCCEEGKTTCDKCDKCKDKKK